MERLCNIPIYQRVTMQVLLKYREKAIRRRQKIKIFGLSIRKQKEVAFLYKNIRKLETCLIYAEAIIGCSSFSSSGWSSIFSFSNFLFFIFCSFFSGIS